MSTQTVEAVFENGVLRPLSALHLGERQRVALTVSPIEELPELDAECLAQYAAEADDGVSLESVRSALAKIPSSLVADFRAEREER